MEKQLQGRCCIFLWDWGVRKEKFSKAIKSKRKKKKKKAFKRKEAVATGKSISLKTPQEVMLL